MHRGVYFVGHLALPPLAYEAAALLATGPHSALSHRSAAKLHRLLPLDALAAVDVTVRSQRRARQGVTVRRGPLERHEVTTVAGLWVTTPLRTLHDLARVLARDVLEQAAAEAEVRRLVRHADVVALLGEAPQLTRSEAERRLLGVIRRARLPTPSMNACCGRFTVDALWPEQRLAVEMDGYAYHHTRRAWERDRRKDAALEAAGLRLLRVTWSELGEPEALAARLARALSSRG